MRTRLLDSLATLWRKPPLYVLLGTCTLILYARRPDAFRTPQFWAEDGYFFERNIRIGLDAVFLPYNGYLHLVPRLIAIGASFFDPLWIPACYVLSALFLTLYVAARTQSARMPFAPSAGYALAVVLVPDWRDGLLNVTNIQFTLAAGLLLVLISQDPKNRWQYTHDVLATILLGLTGPFSVLFSPFFALRVWWRRSRSSVVLAICAVTTGSVQGYEILTHPVPLGNSSAIDWAYLLAVPGARIVGSLFVGYYFPAHLPLDNPEHRRRPGVRPGL